ncbi:MAG TPA: SsrA-binding protein [Rhodospirillaceae bacterium]|jgi:SsrA-binding protein|nr:SsrA-binding protein [Rhodospirillaceae bacterium]MAX61219.1 SsrA-binding protein [Rhodospirillaceae bacterium]MBB55962.1 SsrA-binding protein [Rhodospirillaceae bacterium]HAE03556.1 SsrA-binding protein [Rhodospirillaceae bacterium]HAJ21724.1 SsrA-binding protein [Rhodospirillaceae bacterium]|tara:strand:+ start:439 stop:930 length:492 start_codon:yes stop_codon:yes gene_type:complete
MAGKDKKKKHMMATGTIAVNRRARHDYAIEEEYEAGIILTGTEVKSLRLGTVNLSDAYAAPKGGGVYLHNLHIGEYSHAPMRAQHEPKRIRTLLLHRKEVSKLMGSVQREGLTLIPLRMYFNNRGLAKIALGLGRGKREYDKRQDIKQRDWNRRKATILRNEG